MGFDVVRERATAPRALTSPVAAAPREMGASPTGSGRASGNDRDMTTNKPRESRRRDEPLPRQASDPERDSGQEDTAAVPGEERRPVRPLHEPDGDEDIE